MKLPPLASLHFFDVAARFGSFVKAAQELHVTHSAISRQIRLLETYLGIELFERRNRGIFLTAEGRQLFNTTTNMFTQLSETVVDLKTKTESNVVSLSCEPTIAMKWLIPRLTGFYQQYPHITVHLIAAGGAIDFTKTGVDLALRRNDFKWDENIYAREVCSENMGLVQPPENKHTDNINKAILLTSASRANAWETWEKRTGMLLSKNKKITYEHFYLCIQAALAGQGIALASFLMVADEIQSKQLMAPKGFIDDGSAYYLLAAKTPKPKSAVSILMEWLMERMNETLNSITK
ncbi:MAG: LysR substrate-binding domain-containing protein [Providencia heimbachae]|nr:LysR substrate-binding domain-containing protein [Providencia heimbachae]